MPVDSVEETSIRVLETEQAQHRYICHCASPIPGHKVFEEDVESVTGCIKELKKIKFEVTQVLQNAGLKLSKWFLTRLSKQVTRLKLLHPRVPIS